MARPATMDEMAPKTIQVTYDEPPTIGDAVAWKAIAANRTWKRYSDRDVLKAWDAFRGLDDGLADQLERQISDRVQTKLKKRLGNKRYGREHDHWKTIENDVVVAMGLPQSKTGEAIRLSFVNFVDWGTVNLIRDDLKHDAESETYDEARATAGDPTEHVDALIDQARARERFCRGNERKLNVISMTDMRFTQAEIQAATGVSHVTQRRWTKDFETYKKDQGIT